MTTLLGKVSWLVIYVTTTVAASGAILYLVSCVYWG